METFGRLAKAIEYARGATGGRLNLTEFMILALVAQRSPDPVAFQDLAEATGVTRSAVGKIVHDMGTYMVESGPGKWGTAGHGLLASQPDPYNRKRSAAILTPKGATLMAAVSQQLAA